MTIKFKELTFKADVAMYPNLDLTAMQNLHDAIIAAIADAVTTTAKGRVLLGQCELTIMEKNT